jgi:hypothetical protein
MSFSKLCIALTTCLMGAAPAMASSFTLDFEGAGDRALLQSFYNGGSDSQGHSGSNFGVEFVGNAAAIIDAGAGPVANLPSGVTGMFFDKANSEMIANVAAGFSDGFSFYYGSSTNSNRVARVYEGLNATGAVLGEIVLRKNYHDGDCQASSTGSWCHWDAVGVAFTGIAHSVDFGGSLNKSVYDNVTFGAAAAVPEPATYVLLMLGLTALSGLAGARKQGRAA